MYIKRVVIKPQFPTSRPMQPSLPITIDLVCQLNEEGCHVSNSHAILACNAATNLGLSGWIPVIAVLHSFSCIVTDGDKIMQTVGKTRNLVDGLGIQLHLSCLKIGPLSFTIFI